MHAATDTLSEAEVRADRGWKSSRYHSLALAGLIVAVSLVVRLAALAMWRTGAIGSEGAEYARIAENLRNGTGYVGIATPGPELMFPPLFPMLISFASLITGNYEWAGRLVALVTGALLPLPVFGIASRLFGRRTAFAATALASLHPLFVSLSMSVYSEGPYATALLTAVYLVLRALDFPSVARWSLVGGAFGIAYLIRQEAVAPLLVAVFFALTATPGVLTARCKRAVATLAVFILLASPEVFYLYRSTGKLRLETKSAINFALGTRILDGQKNPAQQVQPLPGEENDPTKIAEYGIGADLKGSGIWMRSNVEVVRETHLTGKQFAVFVKEAVRRNSRVLHDQLSERWFGAPFLSALALLGVFRRPWRARSASHHLFVILVPATAILATFSVVHTLFPRNYFVLVPFFIVWAANGLVEIARWTRTSVKATALWLSPALSESAAGVLVALVVLVYPFTAVRGMGEFSCEGPATRAIKEVGFWIKQQQNRPVRIMDLSTPVAFHAGAQYVHFPYCNSASAFRLLDAAKVDYIVLRRGEKFTQYYNDWVVSGIPAPQAELVYVSSEGSPGEFAVFRWHRPGEERADGVNPKVAADPDAPRRPPAPTAGPLRVDPRNRRYFVDKHGTAVLLAGSHTWENFQDAGRLAATPFDYDSYLDYLATNGNNFMRLWSWEQANWNSWGLYDWWVSPNAYRRTGPGVALDHKPRFNLEELNPDYFVRLRKRVRAARDRGIYVAIMLFNGFSIERKGKSAVENPWHGHPFNRANNINDIDGDPRQLDDGRVIHTLPDARIEQLQRKYVAAVIDAVNDLDNVLYEVSNEDHPGSMAWQRRIARFVREYESTKRFQHPVGITIDWEGKNENLLDGPQDWVSPNREGGYDSDPPPATGDKIIVADTDHIFGIGGDRSWIWKSLTRGLNVLLMDPYDNKWMFPPRPQSESTHWTELVRTIGYARAYLSQLDLSALVPHGDLTTTHFCLANPGSGVYLVYLPSAGTVEVDTGVSLGMTLQVEWFEPATGKIVHGRDVRGGEVTRLSAPYQSDAVLLLQTPSAKAPMS